MPVFPGLIDSFRNNISEMCQSENVAVVYRGTTRGGNFRHNKNGACECESTGTVDFRDAGSISALHHPREKASRRNKGLETTYENVETLKSNYVLQNELFPRNICHKLQMDSIRFSYLSVITNAYV